MAATRRQQEKLNKMLSSNLNVRDFCPDDAEPVRRICRTHFRSLCVPAVHYYIVEHFRDLIALLVIGMIFQTFTQLMISVALFLIYLFVRARVEMELYISRDCPDLDDVINYYAINDPEARSRFWVAEGLPVDKDDKKDKNDRKDRDDRKNGAPPSAPASAPTSPPRSPTASSKPCPTNVVGCVGCSPTRDDPNVAQLVRLVVAADARRMRIGSRLLAQFENFAIEKGYLEVRLYTNNLNTSHMKFIRQHGYEIIQCVSRTLMRGSLIQWKKRLSAIPAVAAALPPGATILTPPIAVDPQQLAAPPPATLATTPRAPDVGKRLSTTKVVMD